VAGCGYVALAAHGTFPLNIWWWDVGDHPRDSAIAIGLGLVNLGYLALAVVGFVRRRVPLQAVAAGDHRAAMHFAGDDGESRTALPPMMMFPIVFLAAGCALAGCERS